MSGIAGIIRFDGGPVDPVLVARMTATMQHRGPDGITHRVKGSVGLGHCMLRTTPESLEESQPLANEDESLILVMDGWLENWVELRSELLDRNAVLRTSADAELVLRAYEAWGEDCLSHIDGDFAFLIWDACRRTAFAARDRTCLKQLHYHFDGSRLSFATELRPILDLPWVSAKINDGMMVEYLSGDCFTPGETLWSDIFRLPPSHALRAQASGLKTWRYWSMPTEKTLNYKKDEDYVAHYRELLFDCVRRASRSTKPVACEASGGLDSSAIFSIADALHKSGDLASPGLAGYMLAFDDNSVSDERMYARALGEYLARPIVEISPVLPAPQWYEARAQKLCDFPGFPNNGMMDICRSEIADRGHNVVLSGEGGDEWLSGYRLYYAEELKSGRLLNFAKCLARDASDEGVLRALSWATRYGAFRLLPRALQQQVIARFPRANSKAHDRPTILNDQSTALLNERRRKAPDYEDWTFAREGQRPLVAKLDDVLGTTLFALIEQLYAERSLESRAPFYSRSMMEFACAIPEHLRQRGRTTKWLHRQATASLLPQSIVHRTTKADFSCSFDRPMNSMREVFNNSVAARLSAYIDPARLTALSDRFGKDGSTRWELWTAFACHCLIEPQSRVAQLSPDS